MRKELSAPVLTDLKDWMEAERRKLSKHAPVAKAMDYMLKRWAPFARFLDDGRICLTNNAAERGLRGIALGRKSWLFAGSDRGGVRAAAMYTLIGTAKLNDVDPQAWLADVLGRIAETPQSRLDELSPGTGSPSRSSIGPRRARHREGEGHIGREPLRSEPAAAQNQTEHPRGLWRMLTPRTVAARRSIQTLSKLSEAASSPSR